MRPISSSKKPEFNTGTNGKTTIINIFSVLIILAVAGYFYAFVYRNAINAPFFDDFAYLEYILKFLEAPDFLSFCGLFLDKHNGHGVMTAKIAFWIDYIIEGQVNYRHLIIASSALVFAIFAYFLRIFHKNGLSIAFAIPVALFLFNPAYHENIFWAASSWQYTASFVAGILMFVFLTGRSSWSFILAIVFGFITTYTNGNGLVGFLVAIIIPLIKQKYWRAGIWLLAVIITGVIFYWYYPYGMGSSKGHETAAFFRTLISFLGAGARYLRAATMDVIILGIFLVGAIGALLVRVGLDYLTQFNIQVTNGKVLKMLRRPSFNLSLLALIVWLFVTGLGTAWTRGSDDFSAALRFMIYSVMSIIVLYTSMIIILPSRYKIWLCVLGTLAGAVFQLGSYLYAAPEVINFRNSLWADVYNLKNHGRVSGKVESMNNTVLARHFDQSVRSRIYVFPETPIPDTDEKLKAIASPIINNSNKFTITRDTLPSYFGILITSISNEKIKLDESDPTNSIFIALKDVKTNKIHLFAAKPTVNNNRNRFIKERNHFNEGITASVYAENVQPGWYTIGVLTLTNKTPSLYFTDQQVEIRKIARIAKYE